MTALVVGTVLALAALAFVLAPLFMDVRRAPVANSTIAPSPDEVNAVATLREIEFDRATGKLSDADYASLKERYTGFAVEAMRARAVADSGVVTGLTNPAPAMANLACATCGVRPEPDAIYCSACGKFLGEPCAHCGAVLEQPGARFCAGCGHAVAA